MKNKNKCTVRTSVGGHDCFMDRRRYRIESDHWAVELVDIGEGWNGDYNPDDPDDEPLLRFDVYTRKNKRSKWEVPNDSSYCTQTNADIAAMYREQMLKYLMYYFINLEYNESVKKLCERLSWVKMENFIDEEENDG